MAKPPRPAAVAAFTHLATRRNIPTAEHQSLHQQAEEAAPVGPARYPRAAPLLPGTTRPRDADRDPQVVWNGVRIRLTPEQVAQLQENGGVVEVGDAQLTWRGKDAQDWSDLVVQPPPIYVQEKVHPRALISDLLRQAAARKQAAAAPDPAPDLFPDLYKDFNGLPDPEARLEFYAHDQHWSNRMILGDSLQVMASLAEREGLRGKVQCIYFDPPYGIRFNSNWQVSTQSRDVKDGKREDMSREPEQVKAFRDTWKDGIHSYLTYLRDRLTVARELLTESGSIFVQIGDENVHRVRAVMDEVFGPENFIAQIVIQKAGSAAGVFVPGICDYALWFGRDKEKARYRPHYLLRGITVDNPDRFTGVLRPDGVRSSLKKEGKLPPSGRLFAPDPMQSASVGRDKGEGAASWFPVKVEGRIYLPTDRSRWKTNETGMERLLRSNRLIPQDTSIRFMRFPEDFLATPISNIWDDTAGATDKVYVVQTAPKIVQRCILMVTDPGDLVLDPTCGGGTTAIVAEQWGRRWITIDTSRVALALARTRIMAAKHPYYLLADSPEGRAKEQQVSGRPQPDGPLSGDLRQGFVYERAPHVTLKSIANNEEIDTLWEAAQAKLEPLRAALNAALGQSWEEWQVPREPGPAWPAAASKLHAAWWEARLARQAAIDRSIAKRADIEPLYDRPYEDKSRVRVAGPFTVESLSPHRVVPAGEEELIDALDAAEGNRPRPTAPPTDFATVVLEHLRMSGVHQTDKADGIRFSSLLPWPGHYIAAEGRFTEGKPGEGERERRAGILIGPEFGTVSRPDLVAAAREASEARFDVLVACAFNYDAHAGELSKLGPLPILKARMNPELHLAGELKNTGKGNLFVVFGEPDVAVQDAPGGCIQVQVLGVDVFDPQSGEIRSGGTSSIAAWFIDTDYDEEGFFVRHAYFLGAQDPYKSLKSALRAEIDEEAWASLHRDTSRPFPRPSTGRIAVKVINHFGDEVMKVFAV